MLARMRMIPRITNVLMMLSLAFLPSGLQLCAPRAPFELTYKRHTKLGGYSHSFPRNWFVRGHRRTALLVFPSLRRGRRPPAEGHDLRRERCGRREPRRGWWSL